MAGRFLRGRLRRVLLLKSFGLQFVEDRVGVFDLPGLEIDTEVDGLMVIRGVTVRLSEMSLRVHGVEVGLKLVVGEGVDREEIEVGIACEEVVVRLGRGVEVGDCFASIKGGDGELSFKDAEERIGGGKEGWKREGGEVWEVDSKMLRAVEGNEFEDGNGNGNGNVQNEHGKLEINRQSGHAPKETDIKGVIEETKIITPDDNQAANEQYHKTIQTIQSTNSIQICRQEVRRLVNSGPGNKESGPDATETVSEDNDDDIRAAICSQLHRQPSITHPPSRSIKVTTLQTLTPPHIRSFLHRLPMLLRLLLNPIAYFHPVKISSLTAAGSGKWIQEILSTKVFQNITYTPPTSPLSSAFTPPASPTSASHSRSPSDASSRADEKEREKAKGKENSMPGIQRRINAWLTPANFVLELGAITGLARVPVMTSYPIHCSLSTTNVMLYRSLPSTTELKQVVRLGGADATFEVPSFLLPHHEHLLPAAPRTVEVRGAREVWGVVVGGGGGGKIEELVHEREDECTVGIGAHARLPVVMDQELLDWVARVVKASKVMEMEKERNAMDEEVHGFRDFVGAVKGGMRDGMKKTLISTTVNDKWIARMVGKITKKLEEAQGDVGYAGDLKVPLAPYRLGEEARRRGEGDKILW
ncbi:hypothetical protein DSL72_000285 [Monilinia vaccinii-corymbosi]|uniref:Uncharacterized protein n=1 Tax=Monilinia vaccinii-corymbosi TaxID=61207 RepID=A0A8A3PA99_9HELO|nr:hypothetical protein DSL72_000285 [Monilinia vaccinii-corymbosi]